MSAREAHCGEHVLRAEAANDHGGPAVDEGVPDRPLHFVLGLAGHQDAAADLRLEVVDLLIVELYCGTGCGSELHGSALPLFFRVSGILPV